MTTRVPSDSVSADALWSSEDCVRWSRHADAGVRLWALKRLADRFGAIPKAVVAERVDDPDPTVSRLAIEAAVAQDLSSLAERILARYRQGDPSLVATCLQALAKFRAPGLPEAVRARLRAAPPEERTITWVSLSACQVPDGEPMLVEAMNRRPPPGPDEMAGILTGLALGGSPEGQRSAVARLVADYEDLREGLLLDALLPGLRYPGSAGDFLEQLDPSPGAGRADGLAEATAVALGAFWDRGRIRSLQKGWRGERYADVVAACARALVEIVAEGDASRPLPGVAGFVVALARESLDALPRDAQRELAGLALVGTQETLRVVRLALAPVPEAPEEALDVLLSDALGDLPEAQARILERLAGIAASPRMVDRCLRALQGGKGPAAAAAAQLLGDWRPAAGADALLAAGDRDETGDFTGEVIEALVRYGEAAVEAIEHRLAKGVALAPAMWTLDVLGDLPCRRSVAIVLRHFDRLWREDPEEVLWAAERLGARELIAPLRAELREGEDETEDVLDFLEVLHGIRAERPARPRPAPITGDEDEEPAPEFLRLALRCRACGRIYHYEVREILVDPRDREPDPFIRDRIPCKGCGGEGDHALTRSAELTLSAEMARHTAALEAAEEAGGEAADVPSPVRAVAMEAFGRRMNPRQTKAEYESRIAKRPGDPALRVGHGNVLHVLHHAEEALSEFREALRLDPLAAEAHLGIAQILEEGGDLAGAIREMERCVAIGGGAHLYRTNDQRGFPDAARGELERLRALAGFRPGLRRAAPEPWQPEAPWAPRQASVWERTGRNDPCPCGSGKKYKKCCLGRAETAAPAAPPPLPADAQRRLQDRVLRFAREVYPREVMDGALATFHGPNWDPGARRVTLAEGEEVAFLDWVINDFRPPGGAETLIQRFHRERGHVLPVEERESLEAWRNAAPGLYEIESVQPGGGLTAVDCLSGERFVVREFTASFQMARWDLVILRLAQVGGAWRILSGGLIFPPRVKDEALRLVRAGLEDLRGERPGATMGDLLQARPRLVQELAELTVRAFPKTLHTPEGHPAVLATATYEVRDAAVLVAALRLAEDFEPNPHAQGARARRAFLWLRRGPAEAYVRAAEERAEHGLTIGGHLVGPDGRPVDGLAEVEMQGDRGLEVRCFSRERLAWAKRRLADLAGAALRHKADAFEVPKLDQAEPREPVRDTGLPSLEIARTVAAFQHQHLKRWQDEAIPALGGITPRQAAADPAARPRLEQLLREMENIEDRKRAAGEDWMDLAWLRAELGLR